MFSCLVLGFSSWHWQIALREGKTRMIARCAMFVGRGFLHTKMQKTIEETLTWMLPYDWIAKHLEKTYTLLILFQIFLQSWAFTFQSWSTYPARVSAQQTAALPQELCNGSAGPYLRVAIRSRGQTLYGILAALNATFSHKAYKPALAKSVDPDYPRNLAKPVTVR